MEKVVLLAFFAVGAAQANENSAFMSINGFAGDSGTKGSYDGYSVGAGYSFNEHFSLDGSYYVENGETYQVNGADVTDKGDGWTLGGAISSPVLDSLTLGVRAGAIHWRNETEPAGAATVHTDGTEPYYGLEAEVSLTEALSFTAEYTHYEVDSINEVDVLSGGLQVRF